MFNFIIDCSETSLGKYMAITPEEYVKVFTKGDLNWCLQTYLILAKRGIVPVCCSNHLQEDCINIIHSDQLLKLKGDARMFVVCVRADYPRRPWAHYHLVQNGNQLTSNTTYIPHWVQPGLLKRKADRKSVTRVGYAGAAVRGNFAGTVDSWKALFEPYGIEFVLLSSGSWHDLSELDVLVGIRSFNRHPHHTKPPTKLFNAWHANIPFIGGYDSAFKEVGVPGEDYLQAGKPEEVVAAVLRLRDDPDLYSRLVQNGKRKAQHNFTEQKIAEKWEETLSGAVTNRYREWKKRRIFEPIRFQILQGIGLFEHEAKQVVKSIINGSRPGVLVRKTNH